MQACVDYKKKQGRPIRQSEPDGPWQHQATINA